VPKKSGDYLTKREQQIMEVLYRSGSADVAAVIAGLDDAPSNPAVRTHLRILEDKGHLTHTEEGGRFVYRPTQPRHAAARSALRGLLRTFFDDSAEKAMATLLSVKAADISADELVRLREMIDKTRDARSAGESEPIAERPTDN
jgi:BlaI family penicillinase repressor